MHAHPMPLDIANAIQSPLACQSLELDLGAGETLLRARAKVRCVYLATSEEVRLNRIFDPHHRQISG
jgi:hypothetical protein